MVKITHARSNNLLKDYKMSNTYTKSQIRVHWLVVALIALQYFIGESAVALQGAFEEGKNLASFDSLLGNLHIYLGIAVLFAAFYRLTLRLRNGVPPHPSGSSDMQNMVASVVHWGLYGSIFLLPITGLIGWYGQQEIAFQIHLLLKNIMIGLMALHVIGAVYHHFILQSDSLKRMLKFN
jgi:cytochrome b561